MSHKYEMEFFHISHILFISFLQIIYIGFGNSVTYCINIIIIYEPKCYNAWILSNINIQKFPSPWQVRFSQNLDITFWSCSTKFPDLKPIEKGIYWLLEPLETNLSRTVLILSNIFIG